MMNLTTPYKPNCYYALNFLGNERLDIQIPETTYSSICTHPVLFERFCVRCGERRDDEYGTVALSYIHDKLRVSHEVMNRLRDQGFRCWISQRKLCLVLDLDNTLLNSTPIHDITEKERFLKGPGENLPNAIKNSIYRIDSMQMITKLRPFAHTFLREASKMFEMYIYTMGSRDYALEMVKLLDPKNEYFGSRVIANVDSTKRDRKGLDVVLGRENAILILDDREDVWEGHPQNLILMDRYHFFASSVRGFHRSSRYRSHAELRTDESEADGALARVLRVLQKIHSTFYSNTKEEDVESVLNRDVRQVLQNVRKDVLKGCKLMFSRVFPIESLPEDQEYWKLAEQLGATCSTELDSSITHVVSWDSGTEKSRWALKEKKILVNPRWIEAARYLWHKQPEENYPVPQRHLKSITKTCKINQLSIS